MQEFCIVGSYTEDLTNHRTVKICGPLLRDGHLHGTIQHIENKTSNMQNDVGMACQKVCKQGRDDTKVSLHLFTLQLHSSVEKMQG